MIPKMCGALRVRTARDTLGYGVDIQGGVGVLLIAKTSCIVTKLVQFESSNTWGVHE